jgi:flagellar hook-associated protein 2
MGTAATQSFTLSSGDNSVSGLAAAINARNMGVTASVVTVSGSSSLTLASTLAGTAGALVVNSSLNTVGPTSLTYSMASTTSGTLGSLTTANASDTLSGTLAISFGTNTPQTITLDSTDNTLAKLATSTALANLGVTGSVITNSDGTKSLQLTATSTAATYGSMLVNANVIDATSPTTTALSYTASSDVGSLTGLGITVNTDGTLSLDSTSLESILNSDYSGVQGFFQNANSWGFSFNKMLTQSGNESTTGIVALALTANSSIETTLNADISREDALISSETKSLTTELNSANEVLQALPSQLSQVNELYSAITGYNQSSS